MGMHGYLTTRLTDITSCSCSNYASNATLRISETYINARNIISLSCGPSFAPMVAATKTADASRQIIGGGFIVSTTLIAGLVVALA